MHSACAGTVYRYKIGILVRNGEGIGQGGENT